MIVTAPLSSAGMSRSLQFGNYEQGDSSLTHALSGAAGKARSGNGHNVSTKGAAGAVHGALQPKLSSDSRNGRVQNGRGRPALGPAKHAGEPREHGSEPAEVLGLKVDCDVE